MLFQATAWGHMSDRALASSCALTYQPYRWSLGAGTSFLVPFPACGLVAAPSTNLAWQKGLQLRHHLFSVMDLPLHHVSACVICVCHWWYAPPSVGEMGLYLFLLVYIVHSRPALSLCELFLGLDLDQPWRVKIITIGLGQYVSRVWY